MISEDKIKEAIKEYQCSGCVYGSDPDTCTSYVKSKNLSCAKCCTGMREQDVGLFFLGMPKGFNRCGWFEHHMVISIFKDKEHFLKVWAGYNKWNVPVWKYRNKAGHVLVRGLSPRVNSPFLHIFLDRNMYWINCLEITEIDIDGMD